MSEPDFSDPSIQWVLPDEATGGWAARRALAQAIRELSERCVTTAATAEALEAAAAAVRAVTAGLSEGPTCYERFEDGSYGERAIQNIDRTALMGQANPVAPPMRVSVEGERSVCRIRFTEVHQGAPGMAHGGWVSCVLDQLAGHVLVMSKRRGFTGKLVVRYLRPTPLHTDLVCSAWVERISGRTVTVGFQIERDNKRIVEGEALMIQMDAERAQRVIHGATP